MVTVVIIFHLDDFGLRIKSNHKIQKSRMHRKRFICAHVFVHFGAGDEPITPWGV